MTTSRTYDYLNRLRKIEALNAQQSTVLNSYAYAYNAANQRTAVTNVDSSRWAFGYDPLGQVTSGKKYWSDNQPVAGQQFTYGFDAIGNRQIARLGGDAYGAHLRQANYTNNLQNQLTSRGVPGAGKGSVLPLYCVFLRQIRSSIIHHPSSCSFASPILVLPRPPRPSSIFYSPSSRYCALRAFFASLPPLLMRHLEHVR